AGCFFAPAGSYHRFVPDGRGSPTAGRPRSGDRGRSDASGRAPPVWTVAGNPAAGPWRNGRSLSGGAGGRRVSDGGGGESRAVGPGIAGYRGTFSPGTPVSGQPGPSQ